MGIDIGVNWSEKNQCAGQSERHSAKQSERHSARQSEVHSDFCKGARV